MALAFSNLFFEWQFTSLSPVIDNPGFTQAYVAASGTPTLADATDLMNWMVTRFTTIPSGAGKAPSTWISKTMSRNSAASKLTCYDISSALGGTRHGSPIAGTSFTLTSAGAVNPIPEGVAATITLQAPYGSDVEFGPGTRPRARDRGRLYFGPLNSDAIANEGTTNRCTMSGGIQIDLCQWIKAVYSHTTTGGISYTLGVWSRKNALIKAASGCWVDDRPDYQRRRADQGATKVSVGLP